MFLLVELLVYVVYLCVLILPHRDDPELDTMLKERVRWGDPMAHLVKVIFYPTTFFFECIYSIYFGVDDCQLLYFCVFS